MHTYSRIILFDGVCNLCNGSVQFVIRRDKTGKFKFSSLQSSVGQQLLTQHNVAQQRTGMDSIIYIKNGKCHMKSTAALTILKDIGGLWKLFYAFIIIPKPIRDFLYGLVANNRYWLAGKRESCMVPTPELKSRFLDIP